MNVSTSTGRALALPSMRNNIDASSQVGHDISTLKRRSLIAAVLVFGVGGIWGTFANISGAVIASGFVIVESNTRSVQHLTGGIVEKLMVRDGSVVKAGELLIKLDETQTKAQLQILVTQIDELLIRQSRLDAERTGEGQISLPAVITARADDTALKRVIALENIVLDSRTRAFDGQRLQLDERIRQIKLESTGLEDQMRARERQAELISSELKDLEQLFARNLVPLQRVSGLRREQSRLQGDIGYLVSEIAKARARVAETELQIIQINQQRRADVTQEARDTASRLAEAQERRIVLEDQLNRIDIRSPIDGTIHQLAIFTIGGVVRPGETLMRVVPNNDELTFEVRIQPRDIDQLAIGQKASIRLAAANQTTLVGIDGILTTISPDIVVDPAQVQMPRFFVGRVHAPKEALLAARMPRLQPGMPADVFIKTEDRSPISYLFRPIYDQILRAFRER